MLSKALVVGAYQRKAELIARFPDVELLCVVPPSWEGQAAERVYTDGYRLVVAPIRFQDNFHLFFFPTLPRILQAFRPDVVHIDEEPYNWATFLATWQSTRSNGRPIFFTWQNIARRYPLPFRWMEQWVYRRSYHAIAGNQEAVRVIRGKGYRGPAAVIPQFGVDSELFSPAPVDKEPNEFTIGYAGRLVPAKGVDVLVEAAAELRGPWRLVLIADGPQRQALERRADQLGLGDRVSFRGRVSSVQMPAQLRQLDVLVVPSRTTPSWKEQFGRVIAEAMACGVPVIGSDSGEIPNVIGDAGMVVPEGDVPALRAALDRLANSPDLRVALARQGRARVLEHFTHEIVAARTVDVYMSVMARGG